jgi:hypothetical protein
VATRRVMKGSLSAQAPLARAFRDLWLPAYFVVALLYCVVRIGAVLHAPPYGVNVWPDTAEYIAAAHRSLLSAGFWAGLRSPTVPLFYKLLPTDHLRLIGQVTASIVAWLALAVSVGRSIHDRRVRLGAFVFVLAFSLVLPIIEWDTQLLSESLTITLTAAVIAVWLGLVRRPSRIKVAGLLGLLLLWALARDSNAYVLLFALVLPLVWLVRGHHRGLAIATIVGFVAIVAAADVSSSEGDRWKRPLIDVVAKRVLPDRSAVAFFRGRGMPTSPDVVAQLAVRGFPHYPFLLKEPHWPQFNHWLETKGQQTYLSYLADAPGKTISTVWGSRAFLFSTGTGTEVNLALSVYRPPGIVRVLPSVLAHTLYPPTMLSVWLYVFVSAAIALSVLVRRRIRAEWTVPLALAVLALPHAFIIALAGAVELPRHALVLGLTLRLACFLALALALDAWIASPARRSVGGCPDRHRTSAAIPIG